MKVLKIIIKDVLKDRLADLEDALNTLINNKAEVLSGSNDTEDLKSHTLC